MIFNRRVIEAQQSARPPVSVVFAIPDHPWVDSADGAAVRIAMTVGIAGEAEGRLLMSVEETPTDNGEITVRFDTLQGVIHADLKIGANVAAAKRLRANRLLSNRGVIPHGAGFIVTLEQARTLGLGTVPGLDRHIRPYRNGRDLTGTPRGVWVIDLHGTTSDEVRERFPAVYQWLWERVKPERDENNRPRVREQWWLFAEARVVMRRSLEGVSRYIATGQVAKHRFFQWLDRSILPDDKLIAIASDDALHLGVLSSQVHVQWALATGGTLEDRPVYSKSTCFEAFAFPNTDTGLTPSELTLRIRSLAEQIDAHRKAQQAAHADVTLTGMYNVLEKLRIGETLTPSEQRIHEHALTSVLRSLHDELDAAVLAAYGWSDLTLPADTNTLLQRLVDLNAGRASDEAVGTVRWLRPAFQQAGAPGEQAGLDVGTEGEREGEPSAPTAPATRRSWPAGLPDQIKAVADVLASAQEPLTQNAVAEHFTARGRWRDRLPTILDTLEALGRARLAQDGRWSKFRS